MSAEGNGLIAAKVVDLDGKALRVHVLKSDPGGLGEINNGKRAEVRKLDREFLPGDVVVLRETAHSSASMQAGEPLAYTGNVAVLEITHVSGRSCPGLADGYGVLTMDRRYKSDEDDAVLQSVGLVRRHGWLDGVQGETAGEPA